MRSTLTLMLGLLTLLLGCVISGAALAQAYPARALRFIVPFAAAGGTDLIARTLARKLGDALGQPVVVENRTGASGVIGTDLAAKAAPDGHTILIATPTFTVNPSLMAKLPYDAIKDFVPISLIATAPHLLAVNPSIPAQSVQELVTLAKTRPEPLTFSSGSTGGSSHLAGELFNAMAGIKMTHVPYRGTGEAATAVLGGVVSLAFLDVPSMLSLVRSARLRGLAVTGQKRSAVVPELPTIAESGYPGFESGVWYGVLAPARTPREIVIRLNAELVKIVHGPEMHKTLSNEGAEPVGSSPEVFAEHIRNEIARWGGGDQGRPHQRELKDEIGINMLRRAPLLVKIDMAIYRLGAARAIAAGPRETGQSFVFL